MKKILGSLATILMILFMSSFGLVVHTSAISMTTFDMAGMEHGSSPSSTNCATLCQSALSNKKQTTELDYEEKDDEPALPYYVQLQIINLGNITKKSKVNANTIKPPPKIPIHILYGVSRS